MIVKLIDYRKSRRLVFYRKYRYAPKIAIQLKTHIPVYSTSLDYGLGTRNPIEWQRLNSQVEVRLRNYLSTGKYYLLTINKSHLYYP